MLREPPSALEQRQKLARWVAVHIIPCEPAVRAWLRRYRASPEDCDEIIQDAYCLIARLEGVDHIERPDAYFFSIARNLLLRRLKRQQIVQIELLAEIEAFGDESRPSLEREVGSRLDYAKVLTLIAALPDRCRHAVHLRKIEGWSQKQIAEHLQISEKAVEKQIWLGIKALKASFADGPASTAAARSRRDRSL